MMMRGRSVVGRYAIVSILTAHAVSDMHALLMWRNGCSEPMGVTVRQLGDERGSSS